MIVVVYYCCCLPQNIQRKFGSITHSAVRFLGERLQRMGNQFLSSLEVMTSHSNCPTVLLDAETVRLQNKGRTPALLFCFFLTQITKWLSLRVLQHCQSFIRLSLSAPVQNRLYKTQVLLFNTASILCFIPFSY